MVHILFYISEVIFFISALLFIIFIIISSDNIKVDKFLTKILFPTLYISLICYIILMVLNLIL